MDVYIAELTAEKAIEYEQEGVLEHMSLQKLLIQKCYSIASLTKAGVRFSTARTVFIDQSNAILINWDWLGIDLFRQLTDAVPMLDYFKGEYICWQENLVAEAQEPDGLGYPLAVMG
ncbi:hypothetical protein BGZ96_004494, partial [Linnemannia gamsii]